MSFPIKVRLPNDELKKIDSLDQFDDLIRDLHVRSNRYAPDIITIENLHGWNLKLGLAKDSFVKICKVSSDSPNMITLGDTNRLGTQTFFLGRRHPLNVEIKHLIPFPIARRVVNRFATDCKFLEEVNWEEIES